PEPLAPPVPVVPAPPELPPEAVVPPAPFAPAAPVPPPVPDVPAAPVVPPVPVVELPVPCRVVTLWASRDSVRDPLAAVTLPSLLRLLLPEVVNRSYEVLVEPLMVTLRDDAALFVLTATITTSVSLLYADR